MGDPDYPEGGLHHLKYYTYGLNGDKIEINWSNYNDWSNYSDWDGSGW